ncbi:hypothetical protein EHQ12_06395 [Leptospira gomenensis]|uniref:Uncharacterized protein n=1 Tax=Leptospira gomenensis TaxID=2484974 RepID=A0A5F1YIS8_9LEPT|nr:hypothetical protein [Leptospira gomenensis]TGK38453.1 hypothetical protein EHQ17_02100 [Leptospira gomenensis]TGK41003.1 hypothetical protein EHQ12_06395 [Leptospira gomenensis]TGK42568.1 hypothetical protein EHQ07_14195 [Leptospira gomenensis]TGK55816.1 hypothetical protein EHQ13_16215 [Leptospira gomenensis]
MKRILIPVLLCFLLATEIRPHRILLKNGEVVDGDLKENDPLADHITVVTNGRDQKISKKEIAEIFLEESGNELCIQFQNGNEEVCGFKLLKFNPNTVYYMDAGNRYLRMSKNEFKKIRIRSASQKLLGQLSASGFTFTIRSTQGETFREGISIQDETSLLMKKKSEDGPSLLDIKEIESITYDNGPEEIKPKIQLEFWDYLIPGYYLTKLGHSKTGYTHLGVSAFFAAGAVYEFMEAKRAESGAPVLIPQNDGSLLWSQSDTGEFEKHKTLNQMFLISLFFSYALNAVFVSFPVTISYFLQDSGIAPSSGTVPPDYHRNSERGQKIEMKMNINF